MDPTYDIVVIGAGHNGLTAAGYLARAGHSVKVVEAREVVGGAALTEEFHPGFRNSVFSYVVSLLDPAVIRDLELARHGLTIVPRSSGHVNVRPDGRLLALPRDPEAAARALAEFSVKDAKAYPEFDRRLEEVGATLRGLVSAPPPNIGGGLGDLLTLALTGNALRKLSPELQGEFAKLMTMSIGDYLDEWFESEAIKGDFGFEGVIGNFVGPYQTGSAYVLLYHVFGQVEGRTGAWGHAIGGMGAITQAMARSAAAAGAEIETSAPVVEVLTEGGHAGGGCAKGVVLADGRVIRARAVASNLNPRLLFTRLVDPGLLPDDFARRMNHWRCKSGTFRMNVALDELPAFTCLADKEAPERYLNGTINICPSLDYIQAAYDDAVQLGWARKPIVSMCIPSTLDDSLAPPGKHVMSLFCQHFNPDLPDGRSWDDVREEVADVIVDTVDALAPNFKRAILGRQINSPLDIERQLGMLGGDIFHGALHLDQIYALRPAPGYADHRSPVRGLYVCGSGAPPGGGVSGLPGRNAARNIIRDFRAKRV